MEGKITRQIRQLQGYYLTSCPTHLTIDTWIQGLVGKLLNLTRFKWIFHNITKHHHTNGMIKLDAKQDIMEYIEQQLVMGLCNLPPGRKCLL